MSTEERERKEEDDEPSMPLITPKPKVTAGAGVVNDSTIHSLNPSRNINLDPDLTSLRSLKLLKPYVQNDTDVKILMTNEAVYHKLAVKSLGDNEEVRKFLGGYTFNNVMKLTTILKRRHQEVFVHSYFGKDTLSDLLDYKDSMR